MRIIKTVLKIVVLLIVLFLGYGLISAMISADRMVITKSTTINAPAAKVFPYVNNLQNWGKWSPWAKMDLTQKVSFAGPEAGEGAVQTWDGEKTGTGTMTIVKSELNKQVDIRLVFKTPMDDEAITTFTLVENENADMPQTTITWHMDDELKFMERFMNAYMNFVGGLNKHYEDGLADMKALVEAS